MKNYKVVLNDREFWIATDAGALTESLIKEFIMGNFNCHMFEFFKKHGYNAINSIDDLTCELIDLSELRL